MPVFVRNENSNETAERRHVFFFDDGEDPGLVVVVSVRSDAYVDLALVRICLIYGSVVEDAGGLDVGRVGGGYIRGLQSCKLYKSDIYLSGGARGTFCHNSGR